MALRILQQTAHPAFYARHTPRHTNLNKIHLVEFDRSKRQRNRQGEREITTLLISSIIFIRLSLFIQPIATILVKVMKLLELFNQE